MRLNDCNFCLATASVLFILLLLEVILRFLPVTELSYSKFVSESDPIYKFKPNRDVVYSKGPLFQISQSKHVNNDGFYSGIDYSSADKDVVAIIGDSFVEAKQIEDSKSLQGLLVNKDGLNYYAFGASGAPLSQYLAFAQYAKKYNPIAWVFVIIANDFDESMCYYKRTPGMHCFELNDHGDDYNLVLNESVNKGWVHSLIRESALIRYLYLTAGVRPSVLISKIINAFGVNEAIEYRNNTSTEVSDTRVKLSYDAIDIFFETLINTYQIDPKNVLIISDADRPNIYKKDYKLQKEESYFSKMKARLSIKSNEYNFEYVDLNDYFIDDYNKNGNKFEFDIDNHWNEYGHLLASEVIYNSKTIKSKKRKINDRDE